MADDRAEFPPPNITLPFGDGDYLFALFVPQIGELQTKCGIGIGGLFARVLRGRYVLNDGRNVGMPTEGEYYLADLTETIRLALIGGNSGVVDGETVKVDPVRAKQLVEAYVFPARPLDEAWTLAAAILSALINGYQPGAEGAELDKKKADGETAGLTSPAA